MGQGLWSLRTIWGAPPRPGTFGPVAVVGGPDHTGMHSDHHGLELLEVEECLRLLRSKSVGRLGLSADSLPIVLPVRYVVDDDRILLGTGRDTRMAAATSDAVVAFEVDDFDSDAMTVGASWCRAARGSWPTAPTALPQPRGRVGSVVRRPGASASRWRSSLGNDCTPAARWPDAEVAGAGSRCIERAVRLESWRLPG